MSQLVNVEHSFVLYIVDGGPGVTCKKSNKANFVSKTISAQQALLECVSAKREQRARGTRGEGRENIKRL